jgi:hypothetical protein
MKRPGVSLTVLRGEYGAVHPDGYSYSRFCEPTASSSAACRRRCASITSPAIRCLSTTPADGADRRPGHRRDPPGAALCRGARRIQLHLCRGELDPDAARLDRCACPHVRFFLRPTPACGPDNPKAGIHKPSFYDPEVNRTYARMEAHYEVGILPAQPRKLRDKAKSLPLRRQCVGRGRSRSSLRAILHPRPAAPPRSPSAKPQCTTR